MQNAYAVNAAVPFKDWKRGGPEDPFGWYRFVE